MAIHSGRLRFMGEVLSTLEVRIPILSWQIEVGPDDELEYLGLLGATPVLRIVVEYKGEPMGSVCWSITQGSHPEDWIELDHLINATREHMTKTLRNLLTVLERAA